LIRHISEGNPLPTCGTQYSELVGVRGRPYAVRKGPVRSKQRASTQYAKGQYAVRKGPVRSTQRASTKYAKGQSQYAKDQYVIRKKTSVMSYAGLGITFKSCNFNVKKHGKKKVTLFAARSLGSSIFIHFFVNILNP